MKTGPTILLFCAAVVCTSSGILTDAFAFRSRDAMSASISKTDPDGGGNVERGAEATGLILSCMLSLSQGELAHMQADCGRAIMLEPTNPVPYKLRGLSYLLEGRAEQARIDFSEAVRLAPKDAAAHFGLAEAVRDSGNYDFSMREFAKALSLAPDNAQFRNARCWTHGIYGRDLRQGLDDCDIALRLVPGAPSFLDSRGLIQLRLGRLKLAVRNYTDALRKNPNLATAYYGRGVVRLRSGDLRGGSADIAAARAINADVDANFSNAPLLRTICASSPAAKSFRAVCSRHPRPHIESDEARTQANLKASVPARTRDVTPIARRQ